MPHKIRASYIYQRAHELAEGSIHQCPAEIVAALLAEGYPEAADLLDSENIRADLRRVCDDRPPATLHLALRH
ncbi:hypothetical protein [Mesorhizobium sp.]|uniref:hypothetical protein n=1 Tax=Mesorhizobium sp. TaxID=1871066 RepID=UPI00356494F1